MGGRDGRGGGDGAGGEAEDEKREAQACGVTGGDRWVGGAGGSVFFRRWCGSSWLLTVGAAGKASWAGPRWFLVLTDGCLL